jgi:lipopolysaccharide export system protein LptA
MTCKFRALMQFSFRPTLLRRPGRPRGWPVALGAVLAALAGASGAERADRTKPLQVESDQPGKIDLLNQFVVFNGNVVVTKGTMLIRAARIEVRETPEGYHSAVAQGGAGRPATFRQKRDGVDETIEGEAERVEVDGKASIIKFIGNASVRRMRGAQVADEISGQLVSYDSLNEVFNVAGAPPSANNPGGRVRAVLTPREGSRAAQDAAAPANPAASAAAPQLKLTPTLPGAPR